jgi:hypothetical protein
MRFRAYVLSHADETALSDAHIASLETRYSEGDMVLYDDGNLVGTVLEVMTDPFDGEGVDAADSMVEDGMIQASESSPTYIVAREEGGIEAMKASALDKMPSEEGERFQDRAQQHLKQLDEAELVEGVEELDVGFSSWPDPWKEADEPARLLALDAFQSMGASFDGCVREMRGEVRSPKRFCGAFFDEIYGTTEWRGWDD